MRFPLHYAATLAMSLLVPGVANAALYEVGPGKPHASLSNIAGQLKPGDVVEVQGDHTYGPVEFRSDASGTEASPIVIRGIAVNGKRPLLTGGDYTVLLSGDHYTLEGFEVTGGRDICIVHNAHGTVLRDLVVHGCDRHGILGTDRDSGSLTMEYVEVFDAGSERGGESLKHPVYIATDPQRHPGSVFRMQYCYVHDANGGNSVKSRAERNEIYQNWLEGAGYYELEMIGPDDGDVLSGTREDGDVVGNVFFQTKSMSYATRVGGDGSGRTGGRYRFVNNTFVLGASAKAVGAFRVSYAVESIEMYNNIIYRPSGPIEYVVRETELTWVSGRQVRGSNNWISDGAASIPPEWTGSQRGTNPGFVDFAYRDLRLAASSPAIDKGTSDTARTDALAFPKPEALPRHSPGLHTVPPLGQPFPRMRVGALDIGAYEFGSAPPSQNGGATDSGDPVTPGNPHADAGATVTLPETPDGPPESATESGRNESTGCSMGRKRAPTSPSLAFGLWLLAMAARPRRGSK